MYLKKFRTFFRKTMKLRQYKNVVEAAYWSKLARRLSGTSVLEVESTPGNRIETRFSIIGFLFYVLWNSLFFYCSYKIHYDDQTILRLLYKTKLKRYGDDFEGTTSLIYVSIMIFMIPFKLSGNRFMMQNVVDIDTVIEKAGEIIDYHKIARTTLGVSVGLFAVYVIRMLCIWLVLNSRTLMLSEKIYHVVYSDALALVVTALYCYYLIILTDRFKWVNVKLRAIQLQNSWEYKVFVRGNIPANMTKVVELQDRQICEKIKTCARVYGMLYNACELTNKMFGLTLLFTMMHYFNYIILYLFYFMEATASGLFHDLSRYFDFLVYTFWEIAIALGIIYLIIFFSESTIAEAKKAFSIIHQVINEDLSSAINCEAMKFSIQLLHEPPVFTVCGLYNLNYAFLQQGARSVSTYLVILLQFVTEDTASKL